LHLAEGHKVAILKPMPRLVQAGDDSCFSLELGEIEFALRNYG
jgi:hypothetical protein